MENQIKFKEPKVSVKQSGKLELISDWNVQYNGWMIHIPKGFISDGNSVPKLFQWIVPKFGRNTLAGIVHDWLYKTGTVHQGVGTDNFLTSKKITQRQADIIRLDLCRECGVWWVQQWASYIGLRIGGWVAWKKARKAN